MAPLLLTDAPLPFRVSLGRLAGRRETARAVPPASLSFAFVLAGTFEAEGRRRHYKDGLALGAAAAPREVEALSNDALLEVAR